MNEQQRIPCPYCKEEILPDAAKCRFCGEFLDTELRQERQQQTKVWVPAKPPKSKGVAALLSLLLPGAGQMYLEKVGVGFGWLLGTLIAYCCFVVPGIVAHIWCIVNAAQGNDVKPVLPPPPPTPEELRREKIIAGSILGICILVLIVIGWFTKTQSQAELAKLQKEQTVNKVVEQPKAETPKPVVKKRRRKPLGAPVPATDTTQQQTVQETIRQEENRLVKPDPLPVYRAEVTVTDK